jgi:drug/metabolite transporter (DMT)-like permease
MTVAWILLGLYAHTLGAGWGGGTLGWLLLSGAVGFGFGDWALFEALPRLGAGLTVLLCQCLAAPIAALTEWLWLGTRLSSSQLLASGLILAGVVVALVPKRGESHPAHVWSGLGFGILAALGQAWGAVLSRVANQHALFAVDGISAAYQRMCGGMLFLAVFLAVLAWRGGRIGMFGDQPPDWRRGGPWMLVNALAGPALGVSCYQWALSTTPSGIVLPIVATTPLLVMPLAWWLEGRKPTWRALAGGLISVLGVVWLKMH